MLGVTKEDVTELLSFMLDADFNEQVLKCYPKVTGTLIINAMKHLGNI